jgi:flavin-dependent dehydrogenase
MTHVASITIDDASRRTWDAIVVGAGPAGALTARQLARRGLQTLLVDGKRFPRPKVCGGCLNQRAISALRQMGLGKVLDECDGVPQDELRIVAGSRSLCLSLPRGMGVSRFTLDARLAAAAVDAGASFLPETQAVLEPQVGDGLRTVQATHGVLRRRLSARVVVCADGLLRSSLKQLPEFASRVSSSSRLGVGALLDDLNGDEASSYPAGQITMVVSRRGYVGLTRVEGGRLNVAAAVDAAVLREGVPIGAGVASLLQEASLPTPAGMADAAWQGTPPLTSSAGRAAGERLFVVGDAGGYVEPFTGEGIAWAIDGALAVAPLAQSACTAWRPELADEWESLRRRFGRRNQAVCRGLAWILRRPWSVHAAMTVCRAFPWTARGIISRINQSPPARGSLAVHSP